MSKKNRNQIQSIASAQTNGVTTPVVEEVKEAKFVVPTFETTMGGFSKAQEALATAKKRAHDAKLNEGRAIRATERRNDELAQVQAKVNELEAILNSKLAA